MPSKSVPSKKRQDSAIEKFLHLRAVPLFESVEPAGLALLADQFQEVVFKERETIFETFEPVETLYVVHEGLVRVQPRGQAGTFVGPREQIGMYHLLSRASNGIEARAEMTVRMLALDAESLVEVLEDDFDILHHALRNLATLLVDRRRKTDRNAGYASTPAVPAKTPSSEIDFVERIFCLRGTLPFRNCGIRPLAELAKRMEEVRQPAGSRLWSAGDVSSDVLLILAGVVEGKVADNRQHFRLGPGDATGALDAIAGTPRWYDATIEQDLVALRVDVESMFDVFEENADMAIDFLAMMSAQMLTLNPQAT